MVLPGDDKTTRRWQKSAGPEQDRERHTALSANHHAAGTQLLPDKAANQLS
jgi:hypothetical protein